MRHVSLAICLFVFWLALSGHYTPLLIAIGAVAALLGLAVGMRIDIVDREGHPIGLLPRTLLYYPWLIKEIFRNGWLVTKVILHPAMPISPTMTLVRGSQRTAAGLATYANSITLAPGSVPVKVTGREFVVHTLLRDIAIELETGDMNRHVSRFEGKG